MTIRAGKLFAVVDIRRAAVNRSEGGEAIKDFITIASKVRAHIAPRTSRVHSIAQSLTEEITHLVTLRYTGIDDLAFDDQILYQDRQFDVRSVLNRDERNFEWMVGCEEITRDRYAQIPGRDVITRFTWDVFEFWGSDFQTSPNLWPDHQARAALELDTDMGPFLGSQSTDGLRSFGGSLPLELQNKAVRNTTQIPGSASSSLITLTPALQIHGRLIIDLDATEDLPVLGDLFRLKGDSSHELAIERDGNFLRFHFTAGTVTNDRSVDLRGYAESGWVLLDAFFLPSLDGTSSWVIWMGGEDFSPLPEPGAVTEDLANAQITYWGEDVDVDLFTGLRTAVDVFEELDFDGHHADAEAIGALLPYVPPDDIFSKYDPWFRAYDCVDFPADGLEFPEHLGAIPPLTPAGPVATGGHPTDPLIPEGIGLARVDMGVQVDPGAIGGTGGYLRNAGDILADQTKPQHHRYLAFFPTVTNGQYISGNHDGNELQYYQNAGSSDRIFQYVRDDVQGLSNPNVTSWLTPPGWYLLDWVFDPATGIQLAYANGVEEIQDTGGPRRVVGSGQIGILGTRNATSSPDHTMIWNGWRPIDSVDDFTLANHLEDLIAIGIPVPLGRR